MSPAAGLQTHSRPSPGRSPGAPLFPSVDFWRMAPQSPRMAADSKEWSHFSVLGADFDLLLNFSLIARARKPGEVEAIPRLTLLFAAADGSWDGDIETFSCSETAIFEGSPDVVLGRNGARFINGRYRIDAALSARSVTVALDLDPVTRPVVANFIRLSDAETIRWAVVPHLRANGEVIVAGRRYSVVDTPAYHDRNWGRFAWGGAYSWEWATVLPPDVSQPWCLVYSRISDRHRGVTLSQSLILWRRDFPSRKFYGRDLAISHEGVLRRAHVLRLPRAASLLMPGTAADVPRRVRVTGQGYGDELTVRMELDDFAQVVVPNDRWRGFTALCEIKGRAEVTGRIGSECVAFEGRVQAEFNHGAA